MKMPALIWMTAFAWVFPVPAAMADEQYYLTVLRAKREKQPPEYGILFIKATGEANAPWSLETHYIKGLLDTGSAQASPVTDFAAVLENFRARSARVTMSGPYPIHKEAYERGLKTRFQGGMDRILEAETRSQLADPFLSDDAFRLLVVRRLEPWFKSPGKAPDWIAERLRLASRTP